MASAEKHIRFDWAIKRLLRQKANFVILEGFLSELLMQDIKVQEIIESSSNKTNSEDKSNQVDILVKSNTDELMLIEVQNEREHDYFHRMNYGQAKLTTEFINSGDAYVKIKKVISINIVYFELGHGDDYIYVGNTDFIGMHNRQKLGLSPVQKQKYHLSEVADVFTTYYLLKVNRFDDVAITTLDEWIYFLKNSEIPDNFSAKGLLEAKEHLRIDSLPPADRHAYENFVKLERIRISEITTAQDEVYFELQPRILVAEEKAKEAEKRVLEEVLKTKAAEQKALESEQLITEMVKKLHQLSLPLAQISAMTNKSEDEIRVILGL